MGNAEAAAPNMGVATQPKSPPDVVLDAQPDPVEDHDVSDDPLRVYLLEIGRAHLHTADDEKRLARMIEIGKRAGDIRRQLQRSGLFPTATEIMHDAVIVPVRFRELARAVMKDAYEELNGFSIGVG